MSMRNLKYSVESARQSGRLGTSSQWRVGFAEKVDFATHNHSVVNVRYVSKLTVC